MTRDYGLENQVRGIHALAKGIKLGPSGWRLSNPHRFNLILQGTMNRAQLAHNIHYAGRIQEVSKKTEWLKSWILSEATDKEIRHFFKYVTGTSSCKYRIHIEDGERSSPSASTCSTSLALPTTPTGISEINDHTKENFIHWIKLLISGEQTFTMV